MEGMTSIYEMRAFANWAGQIAPSHQVCTVVVVVVVRLWEGGGERMTSIVSR